jgi:hypothetical protein
MRVFLCAGWLSDSGKRSWFNTEKWDVTQAVGRKQAQNRLCFVPNCQSMRALTISSGVYLGRETQGASDYGGCVAPE